APPRRSKTGRWMYRSPASTECGPGGTGSERIPTRRCESAGDYGPPFFRPSTTSADQTQNSTAHRLRSPDRCPRVGTTKQEHNNGGSHGEGSEVLVLGDHRDHRD